MEIEKYNPNWPAQYDNAAKIIKKALGKVISIHHVGSTSVPNLSAKPRIDIIVEVEDLSSISDFSLDSESQIAGEDNNQYNFVYKGNYNLPFRKFFYSPELNVNLHAFEQNDPEVELNLKFRDHMRNNDEDRQKYELLKYQLINNYEIKSGMFSNYTLGKQDFIHSILRKCKFDRLRLVICAHYSEWEKVKEYQGEYNDENASDHLILYKGVDIIGYAYQNHIIHIQDTIFRDDFTNLINKYAKYKKILAKN